MRTRVGLLTLPVAICLTVAGCGSSNSSGSGSGNSSGLSGDPIKIMAYSDGVTPTHDVSSADNSVKAYADYINSKGGVNGANPESGPCGDCE